MKPKSVVVYGLPHCSTCKKALARLEDEGITVEKFHDVKTDQLSKTVIKKLAKQVGGVEELFSKRAMKYRSMGLDKKELSNDDLLNYMADEYTFIKRPVIQWDDEATAGVNKKNWEKLLG
jgi:arsenate reductase